MKYLFFVFTYCFLLSTHSTHAQYTLQQSEDLFRRNNLLLLAEQYNINLARAAVIQARIWELPVLSAELNAINPQQSRLLDVGGRGQKALAIQQLIYMGGKKKNEIEFARSNVEVAELQFEQLVRNLRYQLRERFYSLHFDLKKMESVNAQTARLDTLTQAYAVQVQKGNIPLKDLVRLQSLALGLKNELLSIQRDVFEEQRDLSILMGTTLPLTPVVQEFSLHSLVNQTQLPTTEELVELAKENNPNYLFQQKIIENNELYTKWQRSLASPDLTAGISYDQRGGAFTNQLNLTLGIPLPLWNRHRGSIKMAEWQLGQSRVEKDYTLLELRNQIQTARLIWQQQDQQYRQFVTGNQNLDQVYDAFLLNFRRGNISLLEFTDFMESYNQTVQLVNELRKQLILSGERINQLVNTRVF